MILAPAFCNGDDPREAFGRLDIRAHPDDALAEILGLVAQMNIEISSWRAPSSR